MIYLEQCLPHIKCLVKVKQINLEGTSGGPKVLVTERHYGCSSGSDRVCPKFMSRCNLIWNKGLRRCS